MVRVPMEVILHLSPSNHTPLFIQSLSWLVHFSLPPPPHSAEMSLEGLFLSMHIHTHTYTHRTHTHAHTSTNILLRMCFHDHQAEHYCGPPFIKGGMSYTVNVRFISFCVLLKATVPNEANSSGCSGESHQCHRRPSLQCQRRGQRSADRAKRTPSFKRQLDDFGLRFAVTQQQNWIQADVCGQRNIWIC